MTEQEFTAWAAMHGLDAFELLHQRIGHHAVSYQRRSEMARHHHKKG